MGPIANEGSSVKPRFENVRFALAHPISGKDGGREPHEELAEPDREGSLSCGVSYSPSSRSQGRFGVSESVAVVKKYPCGYLSSLAGVVSNQTVYHEDDVSQIETTQPVAKL